MTENFTDEELRGLVESAAKVAEPKDAVAAHAVLFRLVALQGERIKNLEIAVKKADKLLRASSGLIEDRNPEELSEPAWDALCGALLLEPSVLMKGESCPICGRPALDSYQQWPGAELECHAGHKFAKGK